MPQGIRERRGGGKGSFLLYLEALEKASNCRNKNMDKKRFLSLFWLYKIENDLMGF